MKNKYKINNIAMNNLISRKNSLTHNIFLIHIITELQDVPYRGSVTYYRVFILIRKY